MTTETKDSFLCIVLTFCVWIATQGIFLASPYCISDDVRQQIFWMRRFQDPALYPPDLLNEYAHSYVSWGVRGIYYCASFFTDPLTFSKMLTAFTYTGSGLLLFLLGMRLGGRAAGWGAAAVLWLYPLPMHNMAGGLARSLALPLMLLFLTALIMRRRRLMHATLLLQAVCIPYIFPACAAGLLLHYVRRFAAKRKKKTLSFDFAPHWSDFAVMVLAAALILLWRTQMATLGFGPQPSAPQLAADPIFSTDGRFRIWPIPILPEDLFFTPAYYLLGMRNWSTAGHVAGVTFFCLLLFFSLYKARGRTGEIGPHLCCITACLGMYAAARILALHLFIPSRQVEYAVDTAVCLLPGLGLGLAWRDLGARFFPDRIRLFSSLLIGLIALFGSLRLYGEGIHDYSAYASLYAAVNELPKDALLAGHPRLMDNVLTFGERNVLATEELAHPWSLGYWARYAPRLRASLDALYAKDAQTILTLRRDYGVTHIVVDERQLTNSFIENRPLFAPYNDYIRELAARPGSFILAQGGSLPGSEVQPGVRIIPLADLAEKDFPPGRHPQKQFTP